MSLYTAFRQRPGLLAFVIFIPAALAGANLKVPPVVWLGASFISFVTDWILRRSSQKSGHFSWAMIRVIVAIALIVAALASFRVERYYLLESRIQRAERRDLTGRIVDILPNGDDRVTIIISGDPPDDWGWFAPRPKYRLNAERHDLSNLLSLMETRRVGDQDSSQARGRIQWPVALYPFQRRGNPGEFDARAWAMRNGWIANAYIDTRDFPHDGADLVVDDSLISNASPGPCLYGEVLSLLPMASKIKEHLRQFSATWRCRLASGPDRSHQAGAISIGLLLGQRDLIDQDLRDRFSEAGIAHLLAVSGMHVGFILLVFMPFIRRIPTSFGWIVVTIIVLLFVGLVAGPASAVRAGLMVILGMIARSLGRPVDSWHLTGLVGAALLFLQPLYISDMGFQLSFLAVFGILGINQVTKSFRHSLAGPHQNDTLLGQSAQASLKDRVVRYVSFGFIASIGAHATTWPIIATSFSTFSWISPLTNIVAVPMAGLALITLVIGVLVGQLYMPLGNLAIDFSQYILGLMIDLALLTSRFGAWEISMPSWKFVAGWYALLLGVVLLARARLPGSSFWPNAGRRLVVIGVVLIVISYGFWIGRDMLGVVDVWIIDVGQGESIVVKAPYGRTVVIDGGGVPGAAATDGFDVGARVVVPMLKRIGVKEVHSVINTHPHEDHLHGLVAVINERKVNALYASEGVGTGTAYRHMLQAAADNALDIGKLGLGDRIPLTSGAHLEIIAGGTFDEWADIPGSRPGLNDLSVASVLSHPGGRVFVFGDMEIRGQTRLIQSLDGIWEADIFIVPHHGAGSSFYPPLWDLFSPEVAIVSAGIGNRYGHPHDSVLHYWGERGVRVLRTDKNGAVRLRFWPWGVQITPMRRS